MSSTTNPSGLKLSYNKTKGYFKGTFYVYGDKGKTSKKFTAKVGGFMVGTEGAGVATIKGVGEYPITITK